MPQFNFTSPEGKSYTVNGPEGATKEQAFGILQKQLAASPPVPDKPAPEQPGAMDFINKIAPYASPIGAITETAKRGLDTGGKALDSAAYEVGGRVTDAAAKVLPANLAAAAGYVSNVGLQSIPAFVGGGLGGKVGQAATPLSEKAAKYFMQSALKPDKLARTSGKADQAINTMLETGTLASKGGAEKLGDKADALSAQISAALANNTGTVSKSAVADYLIPIYEKYLKQSNPTKDLKAIGDEAKEFIDHILLKAGDKIPVQLAQEIKQGNYRALGDRAYGLGLKPQAEQDAKKALTRGLKEGIEQVAPEVKDLNASQSSLINAKKIIENALSSSGNKNPVGLGMVAPTAEKTIAWLMDRSPWLKSVIAQALHTAPGEVGWKGVGQIGGGLGGGAVGDAYMGQPKNPTQDAATTAGLAPTP